MDLSAGWRPSFGWLIRAVVVFLSLLGTCDTSTLCGMQLLEPKAQDQKPQAMEADHALPGTWPWLISIQLYTARGPRHSCDGAIIDARWILTAAHCFSAKRDSLKSWKVVLGVTDLSRLPDTVQIRSIKRIVLHQDYNLFTAINDIALIELDSPVNFDNYVQPICLPPISTDSEAFSSCHISSWSSKGMSAAVYGARANILETPTCNGSRWYNGGMNPHTLCANLQDRDKDSCQGNFGGLLTCQTSPKSPYFLVGISNFETDCAKTKDPIIYTSIPQFVEWISTKMMGPEGTLEEKHLQNRNKEDINPASVPNPTKETRTMEPPYVPQEAVSTILEAPYVPDETPPLTPVSHFIPRKPPFVAVDKSSPWRPKSVDRPEHRFPKTIILPPQYVPPEAKVTLEPEYIPPETSAQLQPPYLLPEPSVYIETPYIPPEITAPLEPPYTLRETTTSLEPPYVPPETTASLEPPYTLHETTRTLEPPYIPPETTASLEPPYTLHETTRSLEPPYIPTETTASMEPPYTLQETTRSLEPPYIPLEMTASLEPPFTLWETPSSLEPPYTPMETPLQKRRSPYIPTEASATLEPSYVQLEIPPSLETSYTSPGTPVTLEPLPKPLGL